MRWAHPLEEQQATVCIRVGGRAFLNHCASAQKGAGRDWGTLLCLYPERGTWSPLLILSRNLSLSWVEVVSVALNRKHLSYHWKFVISLWTLRNKYCPFLSSPVPAGSMASYSCRCSLFEWKMTDICRLSTPEATLLTPVVTVAVSFILQRQSCTRFPRTWGSTLERFLREGGADTKQSCPRVA